MAAVWILLGATGLFVLEVGLTLVHSTPALLHMAAWIKIPLLCLALWVFKSKLRELKEFQRRPKLIVNTRILLQEAGVLEFDDLSEEGATAALDAFIVNVLAGFHTAMEEPDRRLNVNVMDERDGALQIRCHFPTDAPYELNLKLPVRTSGAGVAYSEGTSVLIPNISYLHGIRISLPDLQSGSYERVYKLLPEVYVRVATEPFKCILSVPIKPAGSLNPVAVLNLDSKRANSFGEMDIQYAEVASSLISMAIDRFQKRRQN